MILQRLILQISTRNPLLFTEDKQFSILKLYSTVANVIHKAFVLLMFLIKHFSSDFKDDDKIIKGIVCKSWISD